MKNATVLFLGLAGLLLIAVPLHAQTGCTDSPENPTVVLAVVGGAGALFSTLRTRLRSRRRTPKYPEG